MTITGTDVKNQFTGTGANTPLATTFKFYATSDLQVVKRVTATGVETVLVENTHYTVTGGSGATGTVTPIDGATDFPATVTWTLQRVTPLTQVFDFVENDDFPAERHEEALDRAVMQAQEVDERMDRALKYPDSDDAALSSTLPSEEQRASKYLAFDADGEPIASTAPAGGVSVSTFAETILDDTTAAAVRTTIDAQEDVMTTRGDLVTRDGAGTARIGIGAAGQFLKSDGTDAMWDNVGAGLGTSIGYLAGLALSNDAGDTDHDIAVAAGGARSSDDAMTMLRATAIVKRIDATWAAGTGQGGMNDGDVVGANETFHVFLIAKDDNSVVDVGFDTSLTAAGLLADTAVIAAGITKYRRIGSVMTDGASNIHQFFVAGDFVFWKTPPLDLDLSATITTARSSRAIRVPAGIETVAFVQAHSKHSAQHLVYVSSLSATDSAPASNAAPLYTINQSTVGTEGYGNVFVKTDTSRQIGVRATTTVDTFRLVTLGYIDSRGK